MLDLYKLSRIFILYTLRVILLVGSSLYCTQLNANQTTNRMMEHPQSHEYDWVTRYFNSTDEDTSIEELIDFLVTLKISLQAKGYDVPSLTDLCMDLREGLIANGIDVDEDEIENIYETILAKEAEIVFSPIINNRLNQDSPFSILQVKKKKKQDHSDKNKKEFKCSGEFAVGFVKALAGGLCCIIPSPVTLRIGGALIISGVTDMIKHASDPVDEEDSEEKLKNLPNPHYRKRD